MSYVNSFCSCEGCSTTFMLPALPSNCDLLPDESEILAVIILPKGVMPPTDWQSAESWSGVIDNADTTNTFGKIIQGIGGVGVPEKVVTQIAKGVERVSQKTYTLNHLIPSLGNRQVRDFLTKMQCGRKGFSFWYYTVGGILFGGPKGIQPSFLDADLFLNPGKGNYEQGNMILKYVTAGCDPISAKVPNLLQSIDGTPTYGVAGFNGTDVFGFSATDVFMGG